MRLFNVHRIISLAAVFCLGQAGCVNDSVPVTESDSELAASVVAEQPNLSIAQIAGVLLAANGNEVAQAEIAVQKATDTRVRSFAEMMASHHGQAVDRVNALLAEREVEPADSALSQSFTIRGAAEAALLTNASGQMFDILYMDGQIAAHHQALLALEGSRVADAEDAEIRNLVREQRTTILVHLVLAATIRQSLSAQLLVD